MSHTKLTRQVEVAFEPTPEDLALVFAHMDASQQAIFFARVWTIAKDWPGAGWCQQSYEIAKCLSREGRDTLSTLNAHVFPEICPECRGEKQPDDQLCQPCTNWLMGKEP